MLTLRCQALSKSFGPIKALCDVTLDFPHSGITAIIGSNGAGKTTLINVLSGFLKADAGCCFVNGKDTTHFPPYRLVALGLARTFQDLRLIPSVSALENVMLACSRQSSEKIGPALLRLRLRRDEMRNRENAFRWLRFVGLEMAALNLASELSYGQQKLLVLASCLATEARIVLLDEPVTGIHPEMVFRLSELLRILAGQGRMIVFVEHDIASVRSLADHLIVMDSGRVVAQGQSEEVLKRPEVMEAYLG